MTCTIQDGILIKCVAEEPEIFLPEGITEIQYNAFAHNQNIAIVHLPEGITSIGNGAFFDCCNLQEIYLPETLATIGWYAFQDCIHLKTIHFPGSLKEIGSIAFQNCKSLQSVQLPDNLISLGKGAFADCVSLREVILGHSIQTFGPGCFERCNSLELIQSDSQEPVGITTTGKQVTIPSHLLQNGILSGNHFIKEIRIPDDVTSLAACAFKDCCALETVEFPATLKEIGNEAFSGCSQLHSPQFNDGLEVIGKYAFKECQSIKSIQFPSSVGQVGCRAFENCLSLTSAVFQDCKAKIDNAIFSGCKLLSRLVLPSGANWISCNIVEDCSSLEDIDWVGSSSLIVVAENIHGKEQYIPRHLTRCFYRGIFAGWPAIRKADNQNLPCDGYYHAPFERCINLEAVTIPDDAGYIYDRAFSRSLINEIHIPGSVENIGSAAFSMCTHLRKVYIAEGVQRIERDAFANTHLEYLYLPSTIEEIHKDAFTDAKVEQLWCQEWKKEYSPAFSHVTIRELHVNNLTSVPPSHKEAAVMGYLSEGTHDPDSDRTKQYEAYIKKYKIHAT